MFLNVYILLFYHQIFTKKILQFFILNINKNDTYFSYKIICLLFKYKYIYIHSDILKRRLFICKMHFLEILILFSLFLASIYSANFFYDEPLIIGYTFMAIGVAGFAISCIYDFVCNKFL